MVTHGGRSGLVEGTATTAHELILSTERMNAIERVDVMGRTMRVQSGAILQRVQEEAERHDLLFALEGAALNLGVWVDAAAARPVMLGAQRAAVAAAERAPAKVALAAAAGTPFRSQAAQASPSSAARRGPQENGSGVPRVYPAGFAHTPQHHLLC